MHDSQLCGDCLYLTGRDDAFLGVVLVDFVVQKVKHDHFVRNARYVQVLAHPVHVQALYVEYLVDRKRGTAALVPVREFVVPVLVGRVAVYSFQGDPCGEVAFLDVVLESHMDVLDPHL